MGVQTWSLLRVKIEQLRAVQLAAKSAYWNEIHPGYARDAESFIDSLIAEIKDLMIQMAAENGWPAPTQAELNARIGRRAVGVDTAHRTV